MSSFCFHEGQIEGFAKYLPQSLTAGTRKKTMAFSESNLQGLTFRFQPLKLVNNSATSNRFFGWIFSKAGFSLPPENSAEATDIQNEPSYSLRQKMKRWQNIIDFRTWPPVVQENVCDPKGRVHGDPWQVEGRR